MKLLTLKEFRNVLAAQPAGPIEPLSKYPASQYVPHIQKIISEEWKNLELPTPLKNQKPQGNAIEVIVKVTFPGGEFWVSVYIRSLVEMIFMVKTVSGSYGYKAPDELQPAMEMLGQRVSSRLKLR